MIGWIRLVLALLVITWPQLILCPNSEIQAIHGILSSSLSFSLPFYFFPSFFLFLLSFFLSFFLPLSPHPFSIITQYQLYKHACYQWYLQMDVLQTKFYINILFCVERPMLSFTKSLYLSWPTSHKLKYGRDWPVSSVGNHLSSSQWGCHWRFHVSILSWVLKTTDKI